MKNQNNQPKSDQAGSHPENNLISGYDEAANLLAKQLQPNDSTQYTEENRIQRGLLKVGILSVLISAILAVGTFLLYKTAVQQVETAHRELRADVSVRFAEDKRIRSDSTVSLAIRVNNHGKTAAPKVDIFVKYAFAETDADSLFEFLKQTVPSEWWEYQSGAEHFLYPTKIEYPQDAIERYQRTGSLVIYTIICATYTDVFGATHHSIIGGSWESRTPPITLHMKWDFKD